MRLIPLQPDSKLPLPGRSWYERISADPVLHRRWKAQGLNIAIPLRENGLSVADFDVLPFGLEWIKKHSDIVSVVVETRRGLHAYFSGTTRTRKIVQDGQVVGDNKGNGYMVFPYSRIGEHVYRFLPGNEWGKTLHPFPEELFPEEKAERRPRENETDAFRRITRARAYGVRVTCIEHKKAHNTLFRFVCWMKALGMTPTEVFAVLLDWNKTNCFREDGVTPYPWSERELTHKIEDVFRL